MLIPVILSGGAGTRLWPLSRQLHPKQLLPLVSDRTLLQETILRLGESSDWAAPLVVCNEHHRFMVAEQLRQIGRPAGAILLEPLGRNTAPAVAVAALQALTTESDPVLLVLPADHVIRETNVFRHAISVGCELALEGRLVTFGILPDKPETGYGYIRVGALCETASVNRSMVLAPRRVAEFVEKPDLAKAQQYLASGDYHWNSGMFMFRASRYLQELERFAPEMVACCRTTLENAQIDDDFIRLRQDDFVRCPADSIDYALMEHTDDAVVIPMAAGWSDVGSWAALWEVGVPDACNNVVRGDVISHDSRNCYLHSSGRLVAAVGLNDHIVVETADAVMVAPRERAQEVKEIVAQLQSQGREEALLHRRVSRPWGHYESIDQSERFQVKRITVVPGARLSLQLHHHRAEHWVVVKGTAKITCGSETLVLTENQSTYIPLGMSHRLENPGLIPLEIIEVQSGSYLGEDDIIRLDDQYGRNAVLRVAS